MEVMHVIYLVLFFNTVMLVKSIKVVPEGYEWVVKVFGKIREETLKPGVNFIVPFFTKVIAKVSMKVQTLSAMHPAIFTKDDENVQVNSVINYRIVDAVCASEKIIKDEEFFWLLLKFKLNA